MQFQRLGEEQSYPFRSQRLSNENGEWFFNTREGTLAGPYRNPVEAKQALAVFLAQAVHALPSHQRRPISEIVGVQDSVQYLVEELTGFFRSRDEVGEIAALAWANNRIGELRKDWEIERQKERIDILNYVMDQNEYSTKR